MRHPLAALLRARRRNAHGAEHRHRLLRQLCGIGLQQPGRALEQIQRIVPDAVDQLGRLPAQDVGLGLGQIAGLAQVSGDLGRQCVLALRKATDHHQPRLGVAPDHDLAELGVARRCIDADAIDLAEPAQGDALGGHAVLRRQHRQPGGSACRTVALHRQPGPVGAGPLQVLGLGREDQPVVLRQRQLAAVGTGLQSDATGPFGPDIADAMGLDMPDLLAAAEQPIGNAVELELRGQAGADRAGANDEVSLHGK